MNDRSANTFSNITRFYRKLLLKSLIIPTTLLLIAANLCLASGDERLTITLAYSNEVDSTRVWPHMSDTQRENILLMHALTHSELRSLGMYKITSGKVELNSRGVTDFPPDLNTDFVAHFIVRSFHKIYRNRTIYLRDPGYAPLTQRQEEAIPRQIKSLPALTTSIEVRLIDGHSKKTIWSERRDTTIFLPHRERFVLNPDKYPGYTDPKFIKEFTAPILRQRFKNPSALRMLTVADRWYLSSPQDDISYAKTLAHSSVSKTIPRILAQLPLDGIIISTEPYDEQIKNHFVINLGVNHGIRKGLRLDVYRENRRLEKIGQIEIVSTSPETSVAREHKIDRNARRNGLQPAVGDFVVSYKRP